MRNIYEMGDIHDVHEIHSSRMRKHWRWLTRILGATVFFILGAIASGIIGNFGSNLLTWLWGLFATSIATNIWPWIITIIVLVVCLSAASYWRWQAWLLNHALGTMSNLVQLDDSLLRLS